MIATDRGELFTVLSVEGTTSSRGRDDHQEGRNAGQSECVGALHDSISIAVLKEEGEWRETRVRVERDVRAAERSQRRRFEEENCALPFAQTHPRVLPAHMSLNYQVLTSSPAISGTHINAVTGGEGSWKSLSNPAFVIVKLDEPTEIHHIKLYNAGSAIVEILGLPSDSPIQGTSAKDSLYKVRSPALILPHFEHFY